MKNHGRLYAAATDATWALGYLAFRLRCALQRQTPAEPERLLGDFLRHSALHKGIS